MFNVFAYDRQLAKTQQFDRMKEKFIKDEMDRRKTQEKLSTLYKKRVETFVLQMTEKPVVTHDYIPAVAKIRDEDPSRFLGPSNIIIRSFKHEKDRIKENIENYKQMQTDYVSHPFEFRKRDPQREIQPMMRFTSKTNFERVASRLKVLMQDPSRLDPRLLAKGAENLSESFILELSKSPAATNKYLAKHLLPELNSKTHFKAAHSLYLGLPDVISAHSHQEKMKSPTPVKPRKAKESENTALGTGVLKSQMTKELDMSEIPMPTRGGRDQLPPLKNSGGVRIDEEENKMKEIDKQMQLETMNPVDVSKKVLMKCNVIRSRKEGMSPLPKGGGHLMSMSERNLKQIYSEIYHKTIN